MRCAPHKKKKKKMHLANVIILSSVSNFIKEYFLFSSFSYYTFISDLVLFHCLKIFWICSQFFQFTFIRNDFTLKFTNIKTKESPPINGLKLHKRCDFTLPPILLPQIKTGGRKKKTKVPHMCPSCYSSPSRQVTALLSSPLSLPPSTDKE